MANLTHFTPIHTAFFTQLQFTKKKKKTKIENKSAFTDRDHFP